jgi:hypothetical protein
MDISYTAPNWTCAEFPVQNCFHVPIFTRCRKAGIAASQAHVPGGNCCKSSQRWSSYAFLCMNLVLHLLLVVQTVGPVGIPTVGTAAYSLTVPPCFTVSRVSARGAARTDVARDLWQVKGELWARNGRMNLAYSCDFHGNCKDLLHAANLRHGTDGFTSPPKEGALRIFSPEKSDGLWTRDLGYQRPTR